MSKISKQLHLMFQLAEARGQIMPGMAAAATFATLGEKGARAAAEGYYGKPNVAKASAAADEQEVLDMGEELISDISALMRAEDQYLGGMSAVHTTSDFPIILASLRTRTLREAYRGEPSRWRESLNATVTTVPDFKPIRSLRITELPELLLRPENTDVKYATLSESAEGYRVANYERAIAYTWEMWRNDDIGAFTRFAESLGRGALRTEALVILRAVADGLPRTPLAALAGAPTTERLEEMERILAERTFEDSDGNPLGYGFKMTDLVHGTTERQAVARILATQYLDFQGGTPNSMFGAFDAHLEPLWNRVLGRDYIIYDGDAQWLEVAFMEGFQGGPKTYVELPDVKDHVEEGSFANHTMSLKVGHTLGAVVTDANAALRAEGAA